MVAAAAARRRDDRRRRPHGVTVHPVLRAMARLRTNHAVRTARWFARTLHRRCASNLWRQLETTRGARTVLGLRPQLQSGAGAGAPAVGAPRALPTPCGTTC